MSVLQRCPSYSESNRGSKERQGPTLGVRLIEVSVKRESTLDLNLSTTATLETEVSGHCREVETRLNVWTVRRNKWPL